MGESLTYGFAPPCASVRDRGGRGPARGHAKEFAVYVGYGMRPLEAIRSATLNAADLLGVSDRGVIAAGKLADLIAVRGNPLRMFRVLERMVWVMKGGEVVR